MLPERSLTAMGNAAFFGVLTSLLIPPNAPVQMYLFGITLYVVGECIGWSIGCIAMKIALEVRNKTVTRESILRVEQMVAASGSANPDAVFDAQLFEGAFIDARASVVYGVFIAIGAVFFSFARARVPKLFFFSTFGMIVLDAFCVSRVSSFCASLISYRRHTGRFSRSRITQSLTQSSSQRHVTWPLALPAACSFSRRRCPISTWIKSLIY